MEKTYTNDISDQDLAEMEQKLRKQKDLNRELKKENEDIKTAIVDLMQRYAI